MANERNDDQREEVTPPSVPMLAANLVLKITGGAVMVAGIASIATAPLIGESITDTLWQFEPLIAIGALLVIVGLAAAVIGFYNDHRLAASQPARSSRQEWQQLTEQYFDTFGHDLGRPLRRILGKQRELRAKLETDGSPVDEGVIELLDEIELQAPNFRLMLSNIQVIVELEDPDSRPVVSAIDPAQIIQNISDRYSGTARDRQIEVAWWSEPEAFGVERAAGGAIDHIVTNLVDNASRFAERQIEIRLTRNPTHFFIRVWDDGPGISEHYIPHVFERGWTPEAAGQRERVSSGLGLYIGRTLATRSGGELTAESIAAPQEDHHTSFTLMLPRSAPETSPDSQAATSPSPDAGNSGVAHS